MKVCSICDGTQVSCAASVNPNTKEFIDFGYEAFKDGYCEKCGEVVLTDPDILWSSVDSILSEKWLEENGGIIDEKTFATKVEYNGYQHALRDVDDWSNSEIIPQTETSDDISDKMSDHETDTKELFAFIRNCNQMPRDISDQELIAAWENQDGELYVVEKLTPDELAERINDEAFAYAEDYVRFIEI